MRFMIEWNSVVSNHVVLLESVNVVFGLFSLSSLFLSTQNIAFSQQYNHDISPTICSSKPKLRTEAVPILARWWPISYHKIE